MLEGRNDAPFAATVGLIRSYLHDAGTRLAVDGRLAYAGLSGRAGRRYELIPGLELRYALAAIHVALSEGRDLEDELALDERLGINDDEPEPETEDGYRVVELPAEDKRLAPEVPTSMHDSAAMAMLAQFGDQDLV